MVEINQKYRVEPQFSRSGCNKAENMVGRVCYIHPQGRYAVLEFSGPHGKSREAFDLDSLTDANRVLEKRRRS